MLKSLYIQNYALIDRLTIDFNPGFSVITGETGAGKSIILGALSLILGQRVDVRYIKNNELKCTIEGVYDISKYDLKDLFAQNDWVYDAHECILRREIWANGKSRAFLNDSPVYLNDLKELGDRLIDVHSQHQNLALNDNLFQLTVVDILGQTKTEKIAYESAFKAFKSAEKELTELQELSKKNKEEEDYFRFQYNALAEAKLQPEEQSELEQELETITHAEEIKKGLYMLTDLLSGGDQNIESMLRSATDSVRNIREVLPGLAELSDRIESAYIDLKDVRSEVDRLFERVEVDKDRQQLVEDRLSLIYDMQQKHSVTTVQELLDLQEQLSGKLIGIESLDEQLALLEKEFVEKKRVMIAAADILSKKRKAAAPSIAKQLIERLSYLGMPNVRFTCEITSKQPDITGTDQIQFLFSANKNAALLPVSEIASGGEISRLMLCLKSMICGATSLPTIIFDEIDTGTSGEIADKMGEIMHQMSEDMQVIVITHLPQIASKGDTHYKVFKTDTDDATQTQMKQLSENERVDEIAKMLSGAETTTQAVENAKVMLGV
jgi:DNA repair protein RecN (Recombination protein N)